MSPSVPSPLERYLGIDLHKHFLVIGGVGAKQDVMLPPRRIELGDWPKWAKTHLQPTDVVVEATTNAWDFYDQTAPLAQRVIVANAAKIALIAKTRVKTDKIDVMALARLLAADLIPEVWVPPLEVRELRSLIAHRRRVEGTGEADGSSIVFSRFHWEGKHPDRICLLTFQFIGGQRGWFLLP